MWFSTFFEFPLLPSVLRRKTKQRLFLKYCFNNGICPCVTSLGYSSQGDEKVQGVGSALLESFH